MYNWYRGAQVCYAFLADVPSDEDVRAEASRFRTSRWFTHGWTLQELIAPLVVVFLSKDWEGLCTKDALADVINEITFIDRRILTHEMALSEESVAERMWWASSRKTTRVEDEAYSLLGIFGITMPTLYGEGQYAFRHLQEEILQRIPDQSLFAWGEVCLPIPEGPFQVLVDFTPDSGTLFASSPHSFASSRRRTVRVAGHEFGEALQLPVEEYTHTPYSIRTQLCLVPLKALNAQLTTRGFESATVSWYLAVLGSQHADDTEHLLGRLCYLCGDRANVKFLHMPDWMVVLEPPGELVPHDALIFTLSLEDLARVDETELRAKTIYLPHPKPSRAKQQLEGENGTLNLILPTWARAALRMRGYAVSNVQGSSSLTLFHASFNIYIHYRHMLIHSRQYDDADATMIEGRIWIVPPAAEEALSSDAAIQSSPPYTAATWVDKVLWAMTLPARSVSLIADSGDKVTLRLGLDLTALSRYNVRIEAMLTGTAGVKVSSRPDSKSLPEVLDVPHETFKLTVPGSVRRALEMKGYSVDLELGPNVAGFYSHSLTISSAADSRFSILVQFLHTLRPKALVVVARVTLGSLVPHDDGLGRYQDGPYAIIWRDTPYFAWKWSLEEKDVVLTTPTGKLLALRLGFNLAWVSEYYLHIDIEPVTSPLRHAQPWSKPSNRHWKNPYSLDGIHGSTTLTLPGHVARTLQTQGYKVHFERLDHANDAGNPVHYRLRLSKVDADFLIIIECSHDLTTASGELNSGPSADCGSDSGSNRLENPCSHGASLDFNSELDGGPTDPDSKSESLHIMPEASQRPQQELNFQARVKVSSSRSSGSPCDIRTAAQGDGTTLDWNARDPEDWGWKSHLPMKDIALVVPRGPPLTLRFGFYLVWYSEYCLMVEIDPPTPLSRTISSTSSSESSRDSFKSERKPTRAMAQIRTLLKRVLKPGHRRRPTV